MVSVGLVVARNGVSGMSGGRNGVSGISGGQKWGQWDPKHTTACPFGPKQIVASSHHFLFPCPASCCHPRSAMAHLIHQILWMAICAMWSKVEDEVCLWYYDGVTMYYTFMVWYYDVHYTFMVWYYDVHLWYYDVVFHGRQWCRSLYFTVLLRYAKTRTWIQILIIVNIYPSLPWWIGQPLAWATMEMLPDPTGQLLALIDDEVMSDSLESNSDADSEGDSPS